MELNDWLTIIVPSSITILGFFISYLTDRKVYQRSIRKLQTEKQLTDLYSILKEVFVYLDALEQLYANPKTTPKGFDVLKNKIHTTVLCAGTEDAVSIIVYVRNMVNSGIDDHIEVPCSRLIAAYVLLAMQIKYDVTGVKNSPLTWYKGKYTTQAMLQHSTFYDDSISAINEIVDQLKLKPFLRIEEI